MHLSREVIHRSRLLAIIACVLLAIWSASDIIFLDEPHKRANSKALVTATQSPSSGNRAVLWTSDLHSAARCDMASMFSSFGHRIIMAGFKGRGTPYPEAFSSSLVEFPNRTLSDEILNKHLTHSDTWTEEEVRTLFHYYRDDEEFKSVDGIVCMFPSSYCEAWMPFNKSIITWAAHRYSLGRCTRNEWERLNEHLRAMAAAQGRGHVVAGITLYDVEYINHFTGIKAKLIPSTTLWYAHAPEGLLYDSSRSRRQEVLIGPLQRTNLPFLDTLRAAGGSRWKFDFAKAIYGSYNLGDLLNHRAMVLFPYATTSWGFIEVYALGIPIFVPDPEFLYSLGTMVDRRMRDDCYCGPHVEVPPPHPNSTHPYSPEDDDVDSFSYWIQFSDFYQWPFITQFSSWEDLIMKLEGSDFNAIHTNMEMENDRRRRSLEDEWTIILNDVPIGAKIPDSYGAALDHLWHTPRLMVK